jgi:hypothetical protein
MSTREVYELDLVNLRAQNLSAGSAALDAIDADSVATDALVVGSGGSSIAKILVARGTVTSGQTSVAITVTGTTTAARVLATISGTNTAGVSIIRAVATANTVTVTLSADPEANTTIDVLVIIPTA